MPTYMLTLTISKLNCLNNILDTTSTKYIDVSVCSVNNKINGLNHTLNFSMKIIKAIGEYLNFYYFFPKLGRIFIKRKNKISVRGLKINIIFKI